jgi:katanin p80 WD40 repeat-containing subunit B1
MIEINKSNVLVAGMLSSRLAAIKLLRAVWTKGDYREFFEMLTKTNDAAVVVDILHTFISGDKGMNSVFSLDVCILLLPTLHELLSGQYEEYVVTSLKMIHLLASTFGGIIKSTLDAPRPSLGIDLSREER